MAFLKNKDIVGMDWKARNEKLKELKMEMIKATIKSNKNNTKTKEIKRAIARILTFNTAEKRKLKK